MLITMLAAQLLSLQGASAPGQETETGATTGTVTQTAAASEPAKTEKTEKVTDRNHPDYMRCRREPIIGSRAKKRKICMTNRDWERVAQAGNSATRTIIADAQPGFLPDGN